MAVRGGGGGGAIRRRQPGWAMEERERASLDGRERERERERETENFLVAQDSFGATRLPR